MSFCEGSVMMMNVIMALPRRPSWSVTRTFCSLSEGFGGAVHADHGNFKPKKKKKRVQPRDVDVCICNQDIYIWGKMLSISVFQPSVFDSSNRPNCELISSVASKLRKQSRFRAGLRCSQPPDDVTAEIGRQLEICKCRSIRVGSDGVIVHCLLQFAKRRGLLLTISSWLASSSFDTFVVDSLRWSDRLGTSWRRRRRRRPKRDVKSH